MKTAVIYARYSCEKQTEQSIEGQLRYCNDFAKKENIVVLDTYVDRATSGTNDHRLSFQRMLIDSDKKAWDYVIVYKLDRFSRNKREMAIHRGRLASNGIKLLSASENIPDAPEGIILESLLEGMAEYYSAELSQKIHRGLNESRIKGNYTNGRPPYGYRSINKKLEINEEQATVVRYIYEQAASGVRIKDIIDDLHKKGVMFNGHLIARNTVYNILSNERYSGIYHFEGKVFDNIYPQIVDDEIFQEVRTRLAASHHNGKVSSVEYLLKGKIYCGYCGKPMYAESGMGKNGIIKRYYKCATRKVQGKCKKTSYRKDALEEFIISIIEQTFATTKNINAIADMVLEKHKKKAVKHTLLNALNKEKTQTENAINNLIRAMEEGIITPSTKKRLNDLENNLQEITSRVVKENARLSKEITKKDIITIIKNALNKCPRQMIYLIIDKIIVYDEKIEIHYNLTKSKNSDDSQGSLFYTGKKSIEVYEVTKLKTVMKELDVEIYAR